MNWRHLTLLQRTGQVLGPNLKRSEQRSYCRPVNGSSHAGPLAGQ